VKPFLLLMLLSLLVPAIGQESGSAQSKNAVVGTWKLVSATETTKKGEVRAAYGWQNPAGLLTYTADGRIMAITTNGRRKPLSVSDNIGAPAEERAEAFATMTAEDDFTGPIVAESGWGRTSEVDLATIVPNA